MDRQLVRRRIVGAVVLGGMLAGTVVVLRAYDPSDYNGGGCADLSPLNAQWWLQQCWKPDPPPHPAT